MMPAPMNSSATSACRIDGDDKADRRDHPLQPVLHAELGEPVAGMQDQRDHRRADAVEDRRHRLQVAEIDVERAERGDDHEVRQDEGPAAGPGAPEAAAQIGDVDADLDRERPRQRLADRDGLAHLLLRRATSCRRPARAPSGRPARPGRRSRAARAAGSSAPVRRSGRARLSLSSSWSAPR